MTDLHTALPPDLDETGDVLMAAWGLIANAYEGDWSKATDEWRNAAIDYRDNFWHPWLDKHVSQSK